MDFLFPFNLLLDWLLNLASSITVITGAIVVMAKVRKITKRFDLLEDHTHENYLWTLRVTIMSDDMPLTDRLEAGRKYIDAHGNGAAQVKYKLLLETYEQQERKHKENED